MERVVNQTSEQNEQPTIFGLRYLEESELTLSQVVGCYTIDAGELPPAGSFTIRLCGDGGDTD